MLPRCSEPRSESLRHTVDRAGVHVGREESAHAEVHIRGGSREADRQRGGRTWGRARGGGCTESRGDTVYEGVGGHARNIPRKKNVQRARRQRPARPRRNAGGLVIYGTG